jgi:outer membrane protein assembly factor BamE (lipoprotein component of BamABCDE complex)
MKMKWLLIAAAAIAGSVVLAVASILLLRSRSGVTEENFDRIEVGMSSEEVEAILGPPSKRRNGWSSWENDRADEGYVAFDNTNRVTEKAWDAWPDDRTPLEKVMDQLPWRERKKVTRPIPKMPSLVW